MNCTTSQAQIAQQEINQPYKTAMEQMVGVVQELSRTRDFVDVIAIVREAARRLTGADGATFVLRDGDHCYYAEENAISTLWKWRRFPMSQCISGWVMLNGRAAVIDDIYADPRIPVDAYRPTFVKSLVMVPIRRDSPIGAIGNYWAKRRTPPAQEVAILQALADTTSVAMENIRLYEEQQRQVLALRQSEARIHKQHDSLEVFTQALAHDLKEPVRAIRYFAELLEQGDLSTDKASGYFRFIKGAAVRMHDLIDSVSRYIEIDGNNHAAEEDSCRLDQVVDAALGNLTALSRERAAKVSCDPLPQVEADATLMLQVVQNLLDNAIRHGGHGVAVHVDAVEREESWTVRVADNGPGVPAEYRERIFAPFKKVNASSDSCGLGLALCRRIMEKYGGRAWCEAGDGGGAIFCISLPKASIAAEARAGEKAACHPTPCADAAEPALATVLLVEDAESDRELARLLLFDDRILQCRVLMAGDGREAAALLQQDNGPEQEIDVVLLDINMAGMDGFELLEHIRSDERLKHLPVIMCTGSASDRDRRRAEAMGISGYVVKPPRPETMKPILARLPGLLLEEKTTGHRLLKNGAVARQAVVRRILDATLQGAASTSNGRNVLPQAEEAASRFVEN